jgi:hypothetical protein
MPHLTPACAIARMGWTVLPQRAHSPHLTPFHCHVFGPVKDALRGRHFGDGNELKQNFRDVFRRRGRAFCTCIQRLSRRWQKCVENDGDLVEK